MPGVGPADGRTFRIGIEGGLCFCKGRPFGNRVCRISKLTHTNCMASELSEAIAPLIAERAAARAAQWQQRRDAKVKERAERKRARDAGLVARHAAKLARSRSPEMLT
jgi:ADP-ribosylglycohydrolase